MSLIRLSRLALVFIIMIFPLLVVCGGAVVVSVCVSPAVVVVGADVAPSTILSNEYIAVFPNASFSILTAICVDSGSILPAVMIDLPLFAKRSFTICSSASLSSIYFEAKSSRLYPPRLAFITTPLLESSAARFITNSSIASVLSLSL